MADVKYYLKHYPAPVFCFTPDAEFPVCNGEKGHFGAELVSPVCNGEIKDFVGGVANNAVPDRASALVETDITKLKNAPNITLEPEGNGVRIRGWGKSGHAATPQHRQCHRSGGGLPAGQRPVQRGRARLSGSAEKAALFHGR